MKIHAIASAPHYAEHIRAVWRHLPASLQGEFREGRWAKDNSPDWEPEDVVMIGGFIDFDRCLYHRVVYVEHGAGQKYIDVDGRSNGYYHGATNHPGRVVGYICPRQEVAVSWGKPAFAAGAPVCDPYPLETSQGTLRAAISFHWDAARICPEASSALPHYADSLGALRGLLQEQGFEVYGHHHPRDPFLPHVWRKLDIPIVDVDFVRRDVSLLICDNSSLQWEMAYLARANVFLEAPWWRGGVEHGLRFGYPNGKNRFGGGLPGLSVESPEDLLKMDFTGIQSYPPGGIPAYDKYWSDGQDGFRAAVWLTILVAEL